MIEWSKQITLDDVLQIARGAPVVLTDAVSHRLREARLAVDTATASETPVYGLNTGVGSLKKYAVSKADAELWNFEAMLGHVAKLGGPELTQEQTRAVMAARLAGLVQGGSGIRLETVELLVEMLNLRVHPVVFADASSLGESDLVPMAQIGAVMVGQGDAYYSQERLPGQDALQRAGLTPIRPQVKETLGLISSNAYSLGYGILQLDRTRHMLDAYDTAVALSLEGLGANISFLDLEALDARPFPGQRFRGRRMRWLLRDSGLWLNPRRLQEPLSFRCVAQVHGAVEDTLRFAEEQFLFMLNSCTDSPLITPSGRILGTGNFESTSLAMAVDALRLGLIRLTTISLQRVNKMLWAEFSDLPSALADPQDFRQGIFHNNVSRALTAMVSKAYALAHPSALSYTPQVTEGSDDYASLAPIAIEQLSQLLVTTEKCLMVEAYFASTAIRLRASSLKHPLAAHQEYIQSIVKRDELDMVPYLRDLDLGRLCIGTQPEADDSEHLAEENDNGERRAP